MRCMCHKPYDILRMFVSRILRFINHAKNYSFLPAPAQLQTLLHHSSRFPISDFRLRRTSTHTHTRAHYHFHCIALLPLARKVLMRALRISGGRLRLTDRSSQNPDGNPWLGSCAECSPSTTMPVPRLEQCQRKREHISRV